MAAYRQPPNLRKRLCRSTLSVVRRGDRFTRNAHKSVPGWEKCGKGSTACCPYAFPPTNQITAQVIGFSHKIADSVNCET